MSNPGIAGPVPRPSAPVDAPEVEARVALQWKHVVALLGLLGVGSGGALAFRSAPPIDPVALEGRLVRLEEGQRYVLLKLDELLRRAPPGTVVP